MEWWTAMVLIGAGGALAVIFYLFVWANRLDNNGG